MRELLEQVKLNQQLKIIKEKYYHLMTEEEKSEFNSLFVEGFKADGLQGWVSGFLKRFTKKPDGPYTPRQDKPLEGEILEPAKPGEAATNMKDITPPNPSLTTIDKVSDAPSFSKKDALKGAAILGTAAAANQLLNRDKQDSAATTTDSGVPPQDMLGGSSPGTVADVSGTEFKPEKKEDYPKDRVSDKAPKFQFTDAEKQGKVSKERLKQWADTVGIEGDVSWKDYGRNFMNMAKGKEGQTLTMKNAPKPTEKQTTAEKKVKSYLSVSESLLAAFNEVVSSKHPNLFAEASKKGSVPKTEKEKSLAALAEPKDKITHKDVLVGRGVVKEEEQLDEREVTDTPSYRFAAGLMGQFPTKHRNKLRITQDPDKPNTVYMGHKDSEGDYVQIKKHPKTGKIHWQAAYGATGRDYVHSPERAKKEITKLFTENVDEEIGFSEAELAHIASIVEGTPIAPTPTDYAPGGGIKKKTEGSKSGTLSDEYIEFANQPGKKFYKNEKGEYAEPSSTNVAKEVNSMSKNQQTHEIEFADKPGQKFKAMGPAPETHEIEFADKPGQKFTAMGPAPMGGPTPMSAATKPISTGSSAGGPTPMSAATTEPAPYGTGSDGKPYKSSIYPDNPLEDAEKALERVNKKLSSGALYKPSAKISNASIKKVFEDHDVVIGKGTVTRIDPKTGKKVDYISPVTLNNPHMQGSKDEFKMPNPVPLPPKRPKELLDLKYKKMATDADIEAIKKDLVKEAKNQEDNEPVATGANKLHVNAKKAADYNTPNVKHKFENGEEVILTRGMAGDFLARHRQAKTADDKDAILKHANKSLDAFKSIARGGKVPSEPKASAKPKISLGSMKGK